MMENGKVEKTKKKAPKQSLKVPVLKDKIKQPKKMEKGPTLESDPDAYYPQKTTISKIAYLLKKYKPFIKKWEEFTKQNPSVNKKNFDAKFREATGKRFKSGEHPASWEMRIVSAMHEISRRLEVES